MCQECYCLELPTAPISSILSLGHQADVLVCVYIYIYSIYKKGEERAYISFGTPAQSLTISGHSLAMILLMKEYKQYIVCSERIKRESFRTREDLTKKDSQVRNQKGSTNLYSVIMSFKD